MGEDFVYDNFMSFQVKKIEVEMDHTDRPFLHEYYNIHFFFERPLSPIRSFEARVINSLIDGFNENVKKMPKYIVIILDKDIIKTNLKRVVGFGIRFMLETSIEYIMKEVNRLISRWKDDLKHKRVGALSSSTEPRVIWTTVIKRPFNTHPSMHSTYKMVGKTNNVIKDTVRKFDKYSNIIYIKTVNEYLHFDNMGKLTASGRSAFWNEVNK